MKTITVYMLSFSLPWENHSVNFSTGFQLDLHKCPRCTGFKIGFDFLGFGAHLTVQRGKVEQTNEA